MLDLKGFSEVAIYVDQQVPKTGWVSLNEIHKNAVVDKGYEYRVTQLAELVKLLGLHVRPSTTSTARWQFEVSRSRRVCETSPPVELSHFRRTLLAFLDEEIPPGESYPAFKLYDKFRRAHGCFEINNMQLGRALMKSEFTTVVRRLKHECTRFLIRTADAEAEAHARKEARTARLIDSLAIAAQP